MRDGVSAVDQPQDPDSNRHFPERPSNTRGPKAAESEAHVSVTLEPERLRLDYWYYYYYYYYYYKSRVGQCSGDGIPAIHSVALRAIQACWEEPRPGHGTLPKMAGLDRAASKEKAATLYSVGALVKQTSAARRTRGKRGQVHGRVWRRRTSEAQAGPRRWSRSSSSSSSSSTKSKEQPSKAKQSKDNIFEELFF